MFDALPATVKEQLFRFKSDFAELNAEYRRTGDYDRKYAENRRIALSYYIGALVDAGVVNNGGELWDQITEAGKE